jgi:hypothetical protein
VATVRVDDGKGWERMDLIRAGIRRLKAGARERGRGAFQPDTADSRNIAVSINAGRSGGSNTVRAQQTVIRQQTTRRGTTAAQDERTGDRSGTASERSARTPGSPAQE